VLVRATALWSGTVKHHYRLGTSYDIGLTQRDRQRFNVSGLHRKPQIIAQGTNERRTSL
jgi:hypothetical protein